MTTSLHRRALVIATALTLLAASHAFSWELRVCADPQSLPFSFEDGSGYENRIAALIAEDLEAELTTLWWPLGPTMYERLREGACDVIIGIPDGLQPMLPTLAYYTSPYVFVFRSSDAYHPRTLDDPELFDLRLGVQRSGSVVHEALINRGLAGNVVMQFADRGYGDHADPLSPLFQAVADGEIDVAFSWGPAAGYYAARQSVPLTVRPVEPLFDPPFLSMQMPIVMGVRQGDEGLRDLLSEAIARRWDDIQAILTDYAVPMTPMARPIVRERP
jgi:mxaJ protein